MYCTKCGSAIKENLKFCPTCGIKIQLIGSPLSIDSADKMDESSSSDQPIPDQNTSGVGISGTQKRLALVMLAIIVLGGLGYYFFLMPDPKRDGKKAALAYCACEEKYQLEMTRVYEDFLMHFDSFQFISRKEATIKLDEYVNIANRQHASCQAQTGVANAALQNKYLNNSKAYGAFDLVYGQYISSCNSSNGFEMNPSFDRIKEKISSIVDPEPDLEKIKNDLLGRSIPGWKFSYLAEFGEASILNTTKGIDRVEYQCLFKLVSNQAQSQHDCEILVAYGLDDSGWSIADLQMIYLTYTNKAPVNDWQRVRPLSDCRYTIIDNGQRYWISTGSYGSKYKGGPDGDSFTLTDSEVFIMSREDYKVDLIFKYTPK
ncbi:MAG: zinc ribbon domain-containing protein [Saprospiraceae bacterium]